MFRIGVIGSILTGFVAWVPLALAQNPSETVYGGVAGQSIVREGRGAGAGPGAAGVPAVGGGAELPFTGLDLGLLVIGAAVLLLLGFALRRVGRHSA